MRAVVLPLVCLGVAVQSGPTAGAMLPAVAIRAAEAGVAPLGYLLSRAGVTAGIVTSQNPSDFTFLRQATGLDAPAIVPLADVLARLTKSHADYRVTWRDGLLGLAPDGAACTAAVRTTMVGPIDYAGDASRVVVFLTWIARGSVGQPRGVTGSVLGKLEDLGQSIEDVTFLLGAPVSMEAALDKVVRMIKGGVWFAWQHTRSDGRVGCRAVVYWPNGLVSAPEEDFFIVATPQRGK